MRTVVRGLNAIDALTEFLVAHSIARLRNHVGESCVIAHNLELQFLASSTISSICGVWRPSSRQRR